MKLFKRNQREFLKISLDQWMKDKPEEWDKTDWEFRYDTLAKPSRGTALSAGYDCYSPFTFKLNPGEEIKIPTGMKVKMNKNNYLSALPRSGHGFKYYLRLANTEGVIDADYVLSDNEGHFWVKLRNEGDKPMTINKGEGMCQLIFMEYQLVKGDRFKGRKRNGGFGSTGI